jgi:anti-sigma regulatory factor (Ser/Thr protein kinase)
MKELTLEAKVSNLKEVLAFIDEQLELAACSMKAQMQIDIAVEEIFVNIAHYAYEKTVGKAHIKVDISGEPPVFSVTFIDEGIPYDPLAKEDPDVTLSADKRQVGGLGIFMVKKSMDEVLYEYKDGKNMLTLKKKL